MVFGNGENSVRTISEIGSKVQFKLKEPVLKRTFSDLRQSDYLKCNESHSMSSTFCLSVTPSYPTKMPASNEVDELDLLSIMMDWPDIFSLNTFKPKYDRVQSVVNIDLTGQISVIQSNTTTDEINLDESPKFNESMNLAKSVITLVSVKCFVDEFDSTVKVLNRPVSFDVDNQCHLQVTHENGKVLKTTSLRNSRVKTLNVKPKSKKLSPKKPENIKKFLERIKLKKLDRKRTNSSPKNEFSRGKNINLIEAKIEPKQAIGNDNLPLPTPGNDLIVKISDDLDNMGPNNPIKIMSNPPKIVRQKPVCFSDIIPLKQPSGLLVRTSNNVASDEPSVSIQVGKRNRRKFSRKKEVVSTDTSVRSIKEYFPLLVHSDVESNGKRKFNDEANLENKKLRVGNQSM